MAKPVVTSPLSPLRPRWQQLVLAGVAAAVPLLLVTVFRDLLAASAFLLFWSGVTLAAWYGGPLAGTLAGVLVFLGANFLLKPALPTFNGTPSGLIHTGALALSVLLVATRRNREDQLWQQREWFQTTLSSIDEGVITTDLNGTILYANAAAAALTGCPPASLLGQPVQRVLALVSADSGHPVENPVQKVLRANAAFVIPEDTVLIASGGQEKAVAGTASPIRSRQDRLIGAALVLRDVTEQRRVESARRASETYARRVLDSLAAFVGVMTPDGILIEANRAALQAANLTPDDVLGKPFEETYWWSYAPEVQSRLREAITRAAQGEIVRYDVNVRAAEGRLITIDFMIVPMFDPDGRITYLVPSAIEITARKQIEQQLQAQANILTQIKDAIITIDTEQRVTYLNEAAAEQYRVERQVALGQRLADIYQNVWDSAGQEQQADRELATTGVWKGRTVHIRHDGSSLHVESTVSVLRDTAGRPIGRLGIIRDITPYVEAEEALRQSKEREREQRIFAEALRDITMTINRNLALDTVLDSILDNVSRVVPHDASLILLADGHIASVRRIRGFQGELARAAIETLEFTIAQTPILHQMQASRQPLIVPNIRTYSRWQGVPHADEIQAYVGVPIVLQDETIGFLNLLSETPDFFNEEDAERLRVFAEPIAIAIQNARLYEQARALAALEERQRLARDLHDAISQTLFSTSLIAQSLPRLWARSPERALSQLEEIERLTRGAQAEMRVLLLELRPDQLLKTTLREQYSQLVKVLQGRKRVKVNLTIEEAVPIPPDIQIALYRITQEALNNIIKHARATEVDIVLSSQNGRVTLTVRDNGQGFDPSQAASGLGITSMHERAAKIGADLTVVSQPGSGTTITLTWQGDAE
ncbi:MAG: PAS domain-containing protein [Chloroflexi bacterium]|nr:PAS domain-containing protein [Chloroflexota bacterium]